MSRSRKCHRARARQGPQCGEHNNWSRGFFTIAKKVARVSPQQGKRTEEISSQGKCKETEKRGGRIREALGWPVNGWEPGGCPRKSTCPGLLCIMRCRSCSPWFV